MRCSCGRYKGEDICIHELGGKTWRKMFFVDPIAEASTIFGNGSYRNIMGECGLYWSVSGYGQVAWTCEHDHELSGPMKCGEVID